MKQARHLPVFGEEEPRDALSGGGGETPVRAAEAGERTVVRVEGMDCASCAATVERRVGGLSGVRRATVNFAAGRLDVYHDESVSAERVERTVREAGYGVGRSAEAERTPLWRAPRVLLTAAAALLFALGGLCSSPERRRPPG